MPSAAASRRKLLVDIETTVGRFKEISSDCILLEHTYIEGNHGCPTLRQAPSSFARGEIRSDSHRKLVKGRWNKAVPLDELPDRLWVGWFSGKGESEFSLQAEAAVKLLALAVSRFSVRLPIPVDWAISPIDREALTRSPIMPWGAHSWARVLHWLGWANMIFHADKWAINGPIRVRVEEVDDVRDRLPPGFLPEDMSTHMSKITNLGLQSMSACRWLQWEIEASGD